MIVVPISALCSSALSVATLLLLLPPAFSYRHARVGSFLSAPPDATILRLRRPSDTIRSGRIARLFSHPPKSAVDDVADGAIDPTALSVGDVWEDHYFGSHSPGSPSNSGGDGEGGRHGSPTSHTYVSHLLRAMEGEELDAFLSRRRRGGSLARTRGRGRNDDDESTQQATETEGRRMRSDTYVEEPYRHLRLLRRRLPDPLWSQIRLEAERALSLEPDAGPQLYQHVLRQPSLMDALASIVSHEIETELVPATALQALVLDQLRLEDDKNIHMDVVASANRSPSEDSTALNALLFHQGLHCLVCYRVAHRLWKAGRTGLAYYVQSTVSSRYSADIHPACEMEGGIYLSVGGGVVIGETARVGRGVTILQGVTLGGTGKEVGDRHPKVGDGAMLHGGATVLGNIRVGRGAVVTAKSIVTKEVPDLARVSGVPATVKSYRELRDQGFDDEDNEDSGKEECDLYALSLDCRMGQLYEEYLEELEALVEMELCIDSGKDGCWDTITDILNFNS